MINDLLASSIGFMAELPWFAELSAIEPEVSMAATPIVLNSGFSLNETINSRYSFWGNDR
jgi:hypothetical protein